MSEPRRLAAFEPVPEEMSIIQVHDELCLLSKRFWTGLNHEQPAYRCDYPRRDCHYMKLLMALRRFYS